MNRFEQGLMRDAFKNGGWPETKKTEAQSPDVQGHMNPEVVLQPEIPAYVKPLMEAFKQ